MHWQHAPTPRPARQLLVHDVGAGRANAIGSDRDQPFVHCEHDERVGCMMRATATVAAGNGPDAYALRDWLNNADGLRGEAAIHPPPPAIGQTGSITDIVTVAVGSGGAAALVVKKVYDWYVLRRNAGALHVRYKRADGTELELKVDRAQDRAELMDRARRFLEAGDESA